MTGDRVAEIRQRLETATDGPWAPEGSIQILGADGRKLLNIDPDGTVTGEIEDASEAGRRFVESTRGVLADLAALRGRLAAVEALHRHDAGKYRDHEDREWYGDYCQHCREEWPCDTAAALATGEGEDNAE